MVKQGRKSAVLLLGGWILVTPIAGVEEGGYVAWTPASKTEWRNAGAFDTAKECEERRKAERAVDSDYYVQLAFSRGGEPKPDEKGRYHFSARELLAWWAQKAECVPAEHIYPPKQPAEK
jgi:hypothetical protein